MATNENHVCDCDYDPDDFPIYEPKGYPNTCYYCLSSLPGKKNADGKESVPQFQYRVPDMNSFFNQFKHARLGLEKTGRSMGDRNDLDIPVRKETYIIKNGYSPEVFADNDKCKEFFRGVIEQLRDTYAWHKNSSPVVLSTYGTKKSAYYTCQHDNRIHALENNDHLRESGQPGATINTYDGIQNIVYTSCSAKCNGTLSIHLDSSLKDVVIKHKHIEHEYEQLHEIPASAELRILEKLADNPLRISGSPASMFRDGLFPEVTRSQLLYFYSKVLSKHA